MHVATIESGAEHNLFRSELTEHPVQDIALQSWSHVNASLLPRNILFLLRAAITITITQ